MQKQKLKPFTNLYCNAIECALGKYIDIYNNDESEINNLISIEDEEILVELAIIKNLLAGVGEVNLKVLRRGMAEKFLEKYNLQGREILSARQMTALSTSEFVGGRICFDVENLLDYAEGFLTELSDLTGKLDIPIFISLGRDIEEVGKLVNRYKMSPAELLESMGYLDRNCFLYGLNYIDKDDQKLLKTYNPTLIFLPRNDGEEGRGAINLYNFIYNDLKFVFSSGKCYNINMLAEGKLALTNTSNLMHERGLISIQSLLSSLQMEDSKNEISLLIDKDEMEENIFDKKVEIKDEKLLQKQMFLEEKTKEIAKRIKEKF